MTIPNGRKSSLNNIVAVTPQPSKGIAADRRVIRELDKASQLQNTTFGYQVMSETHEIYSNPNAATMINPSVAKIAGINHHITLNQELNSSIKKRKLVTKAEITRENKRSNQAKKRKNSHSVNEKTYEDAALAFTDLVPKEVKRLTGFNDAASLISYIIIICKADLNTVTETCSKLTWLEEWLLYFVWKYGRVHTRVQDIRLLFGNVTERAFHNILRTKTSLEKQCCSQHPKYATFEEDEALRNKRWDELLNQHKDKRIRLVMHDMSDMPMNRAADAELNRALYSSYYGGPCAKGGIFTQLCGWEGTYELFTGSVGDSDYVRQSGILELQENFQNIDIDHNGKVIKFINLFDKGYRVLLDCMEQSQLCWQPVFARSDERYGSYATLLTAALAYTRSGNERSVKHLKHSWRIVRGGKGMPRVDLESLSDLWLTWGFQMNFMYEPVH